MSASVSVLGIYACDLTFLAERLPRLGETLIGDGFRMGPGGKGSNQAIAARRAGAEVAFISKLGADPFGDQARRLYADEGLDGDYLFDSVEQPTGTAFIYVNPRSGDNAIIVFPGAAGTLGVADVEAASAAIASSRVFLTQLETPLEVAARGLQIAKRQRVTTVFNPAPAAALPDDIYRYVDIVTPNESEAENLTGLPIGSVEQAEKAAQVLLNKGVATVIVTLGRQGVLLKSAQLCQHIAAFPVAEVVDTTGAGDAFNGGFAAALAAGQSLPDAARFGCATAALSVSRPGCALSMPQRHEIDALLASVD